MNWKCLVLAMLVVFSVPTASHAVDTTRYALISPTPAIEAPQLPSVKTPATAATRWWLRPSRSSTNSPVNVAPGVAQEDTNLMGWTPMSIEALGYDIREVWRQSEMVICISFPR